MTLEIATVIVAGIVLFLAGCSRVDDSDARKRAADKEINTRHIKGTTDVLKNYRLPDVPPKKDPKLLLKQRPAPKPEGNNQENKAQ